MIMYYVMIINFYNNVVIVDNINQNKIKNKLIVVVVWIIMNVI